MSNVTKEEKENGMDNQQVFLSYSRKQFYFAESLMLRLDYQSIPVWFDTHSILAGTDWEKSIDDALLACTSLVLIASRAALASKNVKYELQKAQEVGKPIYIVLFEAVELTPELQQIAVAILDMRTHFEQKAQKLAELLRQPRPFYYDDLPIATPWHLPIRLPLSLTFILMTLILIAFVGIFFDVLNIKVLIAIIIPNSTDMPAIDPFTVFTTHLFGLTLYGLTNEVYIFLSISIVVFFITILASFLFIVLLRRKTFLFSLLPLVLFASAVFFLNAVFLQDATNHIVAGIIPGNPSNLAFSPFTLHVTTSIAWQRLQNMLNAQSISDATIYFLINSSQTVSSPYLSVGDAGTYFSTIAASMRMPTLVLFVISISAFCVTRRSGSLLRWLMTGVAPDSLRIQHNIQWLRDKKSQALQETPHANETSWHLLYHPSDSLIAQEIEAVLANQDHLRKGSMEHAEVSIVLLTNYTSLEWLEELERTIPNLVCILCTSIHLPTSLKSLRKRQWVDYRKRSEEKLVFLARSLEKETSASYSFPAIPENIKRSIVPSSVWFKGQIMRTFAVWSLAIVLFGGGKVGITMTEFHELALINAIVSPLVRFLYYISVPCSLYLFWLGTKLLSRTISYRRFHKHLNIGMTIWCIIQLQFLGYFTNQFSLSMLGSVMIVFIVIVWFVSDTNSIQRWLPAREDVLVKRNDTLAVPLWQQIRFSLLVYGCMFVLFFYFSGALFFADVSYVVNP